MVMVPRRLLLTAADAAALRGATRARSQCRFVLSCIHFMPGSLRYPVHLFLNRQCDQTLGEGIVSAAALLACTDEEIASAGYDAFGVFGLLSNKRLVVSIQAL